MRARRLLLIVAAAGILRAQVLFVPDYAPTGVYAYSIGSGGLLTPLGSSPATGLGVWQSAVDSTGRFLYTANTNSRNISAYRIGATGVVTPVGNPVPTPGVPNDVAVDPMGIFAYSANCTTNSISIFSIGVDGSLTPVATVPVGACPSSVAVDPSNRFLFVGNLDSTNVSSYSIGPGTLTPVGSPAPAGGPPAQLAVDPLGRFVYVTGFAARLLVFRIESNGALTQVGSAPIPGTAYPLAVDPLGRFVYVANNGIRDAQQLVWSFVVSGSGALTAAGPGVSGGLLPLALEADPSGRFLYELNGLGGPEISEYSVGPNGVLTFIGTVPWFSFAHTMAMSPCPVNAGASIPLSLRDLSATPDVLWPPDRKLVDVLVRYNVSPRCGEQPACTLQVISNEPSGGSGNGNQDPDWVILDAHRLQLRAERLGSGSGRVYTITVSCTDTLGGSARAVTTVRVGK